MLRFVFLMMVVSLQMPVAIFASQIRQLPIHELDALSKIILIGQVSAVASNELGSQDITVQVKSILKGKMSDKQFLIQLQTTGVKDFDPQLRPGEFGVFFLKSVTNGLAEKAYFGSIAVFSKPNFIFEDRDGKK